MTTVLSTLLQAQPNAGVMQLVLLLITAVIIFFIFKFNRKKQRQDEIIKINALADSAITVNNMDIRSAGYELIDAGKKLVKSVTVFLCVILLNTFFWINFKESAINNIYSIKDFQDIFTLVLYINLALSVIFIRLLYMGFYSIRKAGETLCKK